jgi:secreted trypsin-like serine protease
LEEAMKTLRSLCALGLVSLMSACGADYEVVPGVGDWQPSRSAIINGLPPDSVEHASVVGLHRVRGRRVSSLPFCSGTLIAEDVVLTAAHCTRGLTAGKLSIYVGDDPAADLADHLYAVAELLPHPEYDSTALVNDIALARLATPVSEVSPTPSLPQSLGLTTDDAGGTINFAGFGQDENGDYGIKLQVDGVLGALGCGVTGCPTAGDPATQISYEQADAGPCFGDSGGPAFIDRGGQAYVAGITSYGDADCTVYGVSTRPDAFQPWIDAFIAEE